MSCISCGVAGSELSPLQEGSRRTKMSCLAPVCRSVYRRGYFLLSKTVELGERRRAKTSYFGLALPAAELSAPKRSHTLMSKEIIAGPRCHFLDFSLCISHRDMFASDLPSLAESHGSYKLFRYDVHSKMYDVQG